MKKITIFFVLIIVNFANSQTSVRFLDNSHIAHKDTLTYLKIDKISLKNGTGDYKDVEIFFSSSKTELETLTIENLNLLILQTNSKAKYSLKNTSTYNPIKISIFFSNDKKEWTSAINYSGQNGYGATIDSKLYVFFNEKGEFIKQM
jgi:hypothetical protein